jgi:choline dehydrogenase-like flavoprotein
MAYRLSEDKKYSVLVLEYGGTDIGPIYSNASGVILSDEYETL